MSSGSPAGPGPLSNLTTDPSLALIPPGFTLEQFLHLQAQIASFGTVTGAVLAILLWDYFILLPDELSLYTSRDRALWKSPATWLFVILRYSGIMATLPSLWFTSLQTDHCLEAGILSQLGVILAVIASGGLFTYRVVALYRDNILVKGFVGLMYAFTVASYVTVSTRFKLGTGPHSPIGSNCINPTIPSWAVLNPASSVAFDTVVLTLTVFKIRSNDQTRSSRIGQRIYRDNLFYFTVTAVTNITVLAMFSIKDPAFAFAKASAVPFSTLVVVTMGTRVFLNLKLSDGRGSDNLGNGYGTDLSSANRSRRMAKGPLSPTFPNSPGLTSPRFVPTASETYVSTQSIGAYEMKKVEAVV